MSEDFLSGTNIRLRAVEPNDIDILYHWENDTSIWRVSDTLTPFSRFQIEEYVMNTRKDIYAARQLRLMIDLYNSVPEIQPIGSIDLFDFDPLHLRAGVGILIREDYREKGYAGEALDLLKKYVFTTLHLHQLYCNIASDNEQSIRLFIKHGFEKCGIKKEWLRHENRWTDEWMFQCIS